jgi:hypothetical protein
MLDEEKLLYERLHSTHSKYTYFLLLIAASAIALVIKITEADVLSLSLIPLGLALLSWGYSFYCGCQYLINSSDLIRTNLKGFFTKDSEKIKEIDDTMKEIQPKLHKYYTRQFYYILIGAGFFFIWHIWGIISRTYLT